MAVATGERNAVRSAPRAAFFYRPEVRQAIYQVVTVVALVVLFYILITNTATNLRRQNIASGFDFVDRTSGFDVSQSLIAFDNSMTYGRAFFVGLLNTLWSPASASYLPPSSASSSALRASPATGWSPGSPPSMWRRSATCRCCCSCSSGTSRS